jgi:hypothetical protein
MDEKNKRKTSPQHVPCKYNYTHVFLFYCYIQAPITNVNIEVEAQNCKQAQTNSIACLRSVRVNENRLRSKGSLCVTDQYYLIDCT